MEDLRDIAEQVPLAAAGTGTRLERISMALKDALVSTHVKEIKHHGHSIFSFNFRVKQTNVKKIKRGVSSVDTLASFNTMKKQIWLIWLTLHSVCRNWFRLTDYVTLF